MNVSNPTASRRLFECPVRLSRSGVSITSPKTGRVVTLPESIAPVRVRGKIIQARSTGRPTATFTAEELRAFLAAVPTPVRLWGGWRHPRGRRR